NQAAELVDTIEQLPPAHSLGRIIELRERLELDNAEELTRDRVDVVVRVELAHALYAEIYGRHLLAVRSYCNVYGLYERFGVVSEAHVDALVAAFSWAVLNEQPDWIRKLDRVVDRAIDGAGLSEPCVHALKHAVYCWRERAYTLVDPEGGEVGVEPVIDFRRFLMAHEQLELDGTRLTDLESQTRSSLSSIDCGVSPSAESLSGLEALALRLGFMEARQAVRSVKDGPAEAQAGLLVSFMEAFEAARRQLVSA
ncbi:MAG: hypothetical protein AAFY60_00350, partial [Myxococcota bacterium]